MRGRSLRSIYARRWRFILQTTSGPATGRIESPPEQKFLMSTATPFSLQPSAFSPSLKYFTQTPILRQIGHRCLARLLSPFHQDLKAGGLTFPEPDPDDDNYFPDLANALSFTEPLPPRLREVLLTIENAASPENKSR